MSHCGYAIVWVYIDVRLSSLFSLDCLQIILQVFLISYNKLSVILEP